MKIKPCCLSFPLSPVSPGFGVTVAPPAEPPCTAGNPFGVGMLLCPCPAAGGGSKEPKPTHSWSEHAALLTWDRGSCARVKNPKFFGIRGERGKEAEDLAPETPGPTWSVGGDVWCIQHLSFGLVGRGEGYLEINMLCNRRKKCQMVLD